MLRECSPLGASRATLDLSPNPPKDTDGRRENRGSGVRELQGRWPGLHWGRWEVAEGLQSLHRGPVAACGRWAGRDGGERTQQETLADRAGASWRGRSVVRWVAQAPTVPPGRKWNRSQPCQGAAELVFPRPMLGKMQSEPACRAGEPSRQGQDPPPEGLGGHHLLAQADAGGPTGQERQRPVGESQAPARAGRPG